MTLEDFLKSKGYVFENMTDKERILIKFAFEAGQLSIVNAFAQKFDLAVTTTDKLLKFVEEIIDENEALRFAVAMSEKVEKQLRAQIAKME